MLEGRPTFLDRHLWHVMALALMVLALSIAAAFISNARRDARTMEAVSALAAALTAQQQQALASGQLPITPPAESIVRNPALMQRAAPSTECVYISCPTPVVQVVLRRGMP